MKWSSVRIHVIDFEGTRDSGVIEYGIVSLYENSIVETRSRFCKAIGDVNEKETRQHGITKEMVEHESPFFQEWELFAKLRETGVLGAHHAQTEDGLLRSTWPYPRKSIDFMNLGESCSNWGPWIDTCQLFKVVYPQLKQYKLAELIKLFQLRGELEALGLKYCLPHRMKYHCALYDALASALLLLYLGRLAEFKDCTLEWLIMHSSGEEKRRDMKQMSL